MHLEQPADMANAEVCALGDRLDRVSTSRVERDLIEDRPQWLVLDRPTEVEEAFSRMSDDQLDLPAAAFAPWEDREPPNGTRRDVIVEAIRHGGIHLGELRLTADLATAAATAGR